MSSSGVGRGRGWLNLNKNPTGTAITDVPRPGHAVSPTSANSDSPNTVKSHLRPTNTQFEDISNDFTKIINRVKELNVNDDGILFNQKIRYIVENWEEDCKTGTDVENSFDELHKASLLDTDLASKLVIMISSRTFLTQEVHSQNIRLMFLRKLQHDFDTCKQLQISNPTVFRNSVQMLGEFYNKARLANGSQLTFMAAPFVSYLEMLLESTQSEDLKLFTIQLYLNGSSIKTEAPDKTSEMLNTVRQMLASDKKLSNDSKFWLLLSLEVSNYRFGILPPDIFKFYQDQLGEVAMANFQGSPGTLSVQTSHTSKALDGYQSTVNVLQVSTSSDTATADNNSSSSHNSSSVTNVTSSSGISSDTNSSTKREFSNNTPSKPGRPILGSGARFHKKKFGDDSSSSNWRDHGKDQQSGKWNSKQKNSGGWSDNKKEHQVQKSTNKGWEHDDRFETDYS